VVFDAAQGGGQVGYQLLRPDDPDRAGGAAGVGGQLAPGAADSARRSRPTTTATGGLRTVVFMSSGDKRELNVVCGLAGCSTRSSERHEF